ncbi:MAG: type IV pilin protein [Gammaproteobacteria bacterium]|jgi:type IV pilus assembly protein PilE
MVQFRRYSGIQGGFTLVELLIVVVIIGILASVAIPSYQQYVTKAKRSAAQSLMLEIAARQEQYLADNKTYAASLNLLGFDAWVIGTDENGELVAHGDPSQHYAFLTNALSTSTSGVVTAYFVRGYPWGIQGTRDSNCGIVELRSTGEKIAYGTRTDDCW